MPHQGTKLGSRVAHPQPFTVFEGKAGKVGVRIGARRAFVSVGEVIISAAPVRIACTERGLLIAGEGVVRQHRETIAITS